ncbi:Forkhead transcription factor [Lithohypha guttulata]|uniref:Forkhead transcription factor n=1 Tax=Lithohypha guttulata TaxID=1690604 RepID=UPI002DDFA97D|nr:Forkhead transcription factor [Lithohypha guttulata]
MSPTRQPPPIQIYQDFTEKRPRPQLAPSAMPLQASQRINSQVAYPTIHMHSKHHMSPIKSNYPPMPGDYSTMNLVPSMSLPESIPIYTDSPQKRISLPSSQPLMPAHSLHPQPVYTAWDGNFQHFDQENFQMHMPLPDNFVDFPDPSQVRRAPLKRSYSETVPSSDKPFKKGKPTTFQEIGEEPVELPEPEDMPTVSDDGQKPPYSYAQMIGMAILRAPGRRLTLASIYDWIATTFAFYREDPKTGWHNSIRHNLSLNKAFIKQERPKSDAGKGCYWVIQPGMEAQFFKDKPRKNNSINMHMQQPFSSQPMMQAMPQPITEVMQPKSWIVQSQNIIEPVAPVPPVRPQTAPAADLALPELSSDATLPASDPALHEEEIILSKEVPDLPAPSMLPPPSSPPVINSSPPVVPRTSQRTSSPARNVHPSHKRRQTSGMDDSGYFSSLESSAHRPRNGGVMLTSELGCVPRKKVGRAEEEIARIRSSSHDITPSGRRSKNPALNTRRSSSPLQQSPPAVPATPPVIFKKPFLPPQSISPNTQLRRHREEMVRFIGGSPGKRDDQLAVEFDAYSPAFKLATPGLSHSFDDNFLYDFNNPGTPIGSSPIKSVFSARPPMQRFNTSAGILSDVTKRANGKFNAKTPSKIPDNVTFKPPTTTNFAGSPLKKSFTTKTPDFFADFNDENADNLFDFGSFPDEASEDGEELDISKGFTKIGSANNNLSALTSTMPTTKSRPVFARSSTSRF